MTTDDVIQIATPIAVIVAAVIQQMNARRASVERKETNEKITVVATAQDVKLETIAKTAENVHILVNSSMTTALKVGAMALRRVSDITKATGDIKAAEVAEAALKEHEAKQQKVDDAVGKPSLAFAPTPPAPARTG